MSDPFIGEIRMFVGNYAPVYWALCEGQSMPINSHDSLYALLGTMYGGDGRTVFRLPDMRGRIPVGEGSGPGLTTRHQGEQFGTESTFLVQQNMPPHNHGFQADRNAATATDPTGKVLADTDPYEFYEDIDPDDRFGLLANEAVASTGGNQAHTNLMPTLCINFIIALHGVFPSRS